MYLYREQVSECEYLHRIVLVVIKCIVWYSRDVMVQYVVVCWYSIGFTHKKNTSSCKKFLGSQRRAVAAVILHHHYDQRSTQEGTHHEQRQFSRCQLSRNIFEFFLI